MTRILFAPLVFTVFLAACSSTPEAPDVSDGVRSALDARGLRDVSVSQDREAGVVTLSGTVTSESDKAAAAAAAQSVASGQVVANQIVVTPVGVEDTAEAIHDAVDEGIDSNMKAMLLRMGSPADVEFSVAAAVVTLKGNVTSQSVRADLEKASAAVPNVKQVVNELQVRDQRATTTR